MASRYRLRRSLSTIVVVASALLVTGCSARQAVAVGATPAGGIRILVERCSNERAVAFDIRKEGGDRVVGTSDDLTLWRIEADEPADLSEVSVGQTPAGFLETVPLTSPLAEGESYVAVATTDGWGPDDHGLHDGIQSFTPGELPSDGVHYRGAQFTEEDFRHEAYDGGKCASDPADTLIPLAMVGTALALGVGALALLLVGQRRWLRHRTSTGTTLH